MKSPDIIEVILKIVRVFDKAGIPYAVGGSLASSAFGVARATLDADMIADIKPHQVLFLVNALQKDFYIDEEMIRDAIKQRSSFNLIHLETMFKVDIFIVKAAPFDRESFSRRSPQPVARDGVLKFLFTTPEDTILHKLEWYKAGGGVSDRQWNDIVGVMKVQGNLLDKVYMRQWAQELGVSDLLDKALREAGISLEQ